MLYKSNPDNPDPEDISRVTDYVVSYAHKGYESQVQEKHMLKDIALNMEASSGDTTDVKRLARKMMNQAAKNRVISKQEACCQLAGLKLFISSERFEQISISAEYKLGTESAAKTTVLGKYAIRKKDMDLSLHQYFKKLKSTSKIKIVPPYVGGRINAFYPPAANYAQSVLIDHFP